ncbi:MAG: adenylate kinase family protein [Bryobacteraceae bacterium]
MILLLFGPPGCGKGTQSAFLAARYHIPAISAGEMFRAECKAGSETGRVACRTFSCGEPVSDDIADGIVASRIAQPDCAGGFLLDGYPRTVAQARSFAALLAAHNLPEPLVLFLDVPDEVLVQRLAARRQCPRCLRIYNLLWQPPRTPGRCDQDGGKLVEREDDTEPVVRQRLRAYHEQTGPILDYYGESAVVHIDGLLPPIEVEREEERLIETLVPVDAR